MKFETFRKQVQRVPVFSTTLLSTLTEKAGTLKVQLSGWKKKGLIVPLRKGLYVLNSEDRHIEPSRFYLANQILIPSYVSLESALSYHELIPEFVAGTTSVTVRKTCEFRNEFGGFFYHHLKPEAYGGFQSVQESEKISFLMAVPEKAIIDFLYLNLGKFHPKDKSAFEASYRFQNCEQLAPKKLAAYARSFGTKKLQGILDLFMEVCVR